MSYLFAHINTSNMKSKYFLSSTQLCCVIITAPLLAAFSLPAFADTDLALNSQQQAWQEAINQQRLNSLQQNQKKQTTALTDPALAETTTTNTSPSSSVLEEATCLPMQRLTLSHMEYLSKKVANKLHLQADNIAKDNCITVAEANELARQITATYVQAGYFKISIHPQVVNKDNTQWQIHIAKVRQIDNQTSLPTSHLFGDILGKPANIAKLDQAVSHAERLIDGRLIIDVYPDNDDIRLVVTQQGEIDPVTANIELRHEPDEGYGHHQVKVNTTLYNTLGQAESISVAGEQSLGNKWNYDKDNQRRSASIYASVPYGDWQWSGLLAGSQYKRTTKLPHSLLEQTGDSWQGNIRGDYTLHRDQTSITTVYGQLSHQKVRAKILDSQIDTQSPTLSTSKIGISRTQLLKDSQQNNSGAWVLDASVEKALGWHDNLATQAGLSDDYWRWLLSAYLTHQHQWSKTGFVQFNHELLGQYSDDNLYAISQQSLDSGYAGVRGISKTPMSANSGITVRNTMSFEPVQQHWLTLNNQHIRWSPYIGVDAGMLKNTNEQNSTTGHTTNDYAYSATTGLTLTGYHKQNDTLNKRWQLDTSVSKAHTDYALNQQDKSPDAEFSTSLQLFF